MTSDKAIIIGGGVIGAFVAYYLHEKGWNITLIEKEKFGHGASFGNSGVISPSHLFPLNTPGMVPKMVKDIFKKDSPLVISARFDPDLFKWFFKFALSCKEEKLLYTIQARQYLLQKGVELYHALIEKENIQCDWGINGLIYIFLSSEAFELYRAAQKQEQSFGVKSAILSPKDLKDIYPGIDDNVSGGYFYKNDATLRPDYFMKEMKRVLKQKGIKIIEHTRVNSFYTQNQKALAAVTDNGDFEADEFILATGACTPFFNNLKIG
jgi:D-amino-acid dehydrogenase